MTLLHTPEEIVARAEASGSPGLLGRAPGWSRVRLGEVATVVNGAPYPSQAFNNSGRGQPLIRIRDVAVGRTKTHYEGPFDAAHVVSNGDLLIGMDGDFLAATWTGPNALLNQRVCRIDVDAARYDKRFLGLVLQGYLDAVNAETSSVTVKHLSSRTVAAIPLPLPPLNEQHRIVAVLEDHLSRLDAAHTYVVASNKRLDRMLQAARDILVRGPEKQLSDLLASPLRNGHSAPADPSGMVRTLTLTAVTAGAFVDNNTKLTSPDRRKVRDLWLQGGDILVQRSNTPELVGTSALYQGPSDWAIFPDLLIRVRVDETRLRPAYAAMVLASSAARRRFRSRAKGLAGSMPKIDQETIATTPVAVPTLAEQDEALREFDSVRASIARQRHAIAVLSPRGAALRRSVLFAAFDGRL